ncbi:Chitin synthase chs-2 [Frankliniella fusca]|uniref:chitin synthase n=1 Tax=Frankliniella fusca TaxID=407009 RepID=A0AAE1GWE3_9NEOP|nr:Chitin synthase chs-2 [Frankliniella fusca]
MSPQDKIASMAAALGQRGNHHDGSDDNFSDDESTPLTQDIYGGSTRTVQETKGWDVFRDLPPKTDSGSMANQRCLDITVKILKVVAYLVTFVIVLGSGVVAKGSLLLMTGMLQSKRVVPVSNVKFGRENSYVYEVADEERVAFTWMLLLAFAVPELGTLFRSARICFFKSWRRPPFLDFLLVFVMETLHAAGTALLVFAVMPQLDVVQGLMLTNSLCLVPGVLGMLSRTNKEGQRFVKVLVDLGAIVAQCTALVVWPVLLNSKDTTRPVYGARLWIIPVAVVCISCGWWENYVNKQSPIGFVKTLGRVKERLKRTRYFTYMFISVWKIMVMFTMMLIVVLFEYGNVAHIFQVLPKALSEHQITIYEVKIPGSSTPVDLLSDLNPTGDVETEQAMYKFALYTCMVQVFAAYICYIFGKFACKIMIQGFSYAFPVSLTVPVTISLAIAACGLRKDDPGYFASILPSYIFFKSPDLDDLNNFVFGDHQAWVWLLWLLSQTWITLHIWTPKCERLATTEKLFVTPMYQGLLIDQSMAMNRRRDDEADVKTEDLTELEKGVDEYYETISIHTDASGSTPGKSVKSSDYITRIYACCTMWHETKEEMMEMLKSILRMDEDQCARRVAQKYLRVVDPDYYEFETHIFFDDAFEISDVNDDWSVCNRFVKLLVAIMDEAASHVHETNIRMRPPKKYPTPYGGRLEWILPGKTKMIAHLKDKSKIRHRKRWSQVMYMYYLLGHRLMELPISVDRKEVMAENTFLLTLDGDIDFQPHAVQLLIDLMKKNRNLGAACGRIHPVGSGPMVWYQMFEYAIGHWLQKATEHMIGCVLCSPGCFSLFRGKSLMDDNVMRKYTTRSDEARHYVQYDQGEDRWLCTLLLQRGYRVEYSAASDAYTHCPEGFNEFYNQRRRWVPSTIANIMDLLVDAKRTIKINDNISMPYIAYQMMLMGGTILGPGTIFLMLVGAFVAAFKIDNWTSFYYNIIPIMLFMLICFTCKANIQLLFAQILSTGYAMVMMAVIVGTALQLGEDGIGSPSAIFLIALSSSFFIAACLHPQEFWCVMHGIIYLMSIPSMYLLLILYSIINLNVVSWGTREVVAKKTKKVRPRSFGHGFARSSSGGGACACVRVLRLVQPRVAQLLTIAYAMVMLAVLVAVLMQMAEDGALSPSSLFFYAIALSFVITAFLHPMELLTICCGLLYYTLVPSMYLLMVIYAICNLNNVTWGTREVKTKKTAKELEEERKEAEEAKRKARQKSLLGFLQNVNSGGGVDGDEGGIEISLAGLFKCIFCTHPKSVDDKAQLVRIAESLDSLGKRLQNIEQVVDPQGQHGGRRRTASAGSRDHHLGSLAEEHSEEDHLNDSDSDTATTEGKQKRDDLVDPYWIEDRDLKRGEVDFISTTEMQFWKDLLVKYLHPIDDDKNERARIAHDLKELRDKSVFAFFMVNAIFVLIVFLLQLNKDLLHVKWPLGVKTNITYDEATQEARIAADLIELRNKSVFAFFMFNALFVLIVFLLQLNKDQLHVDWPLGVKTNITYIEETSEVLISKEYLQLEPIGLVFVFFFALILVIQFTAMLFHRFGTLSHILASAELTLCWNKKVEDLSQDALLDKHAVDIVRNLQRLRGIDGDYDNDSGSSADRVGHRRTIHNLEKQRQKKRTIGTLDVAFKKRFFNMKEGGAAPGTPVLGRKLTMRQETIKALETRRNSVMAERKKSHMQTLGAAHEYGVTAAAALSPGGTLIGAAGVGGVATRNHRNSVASMNVKDLFDGHGGQVNRAYEPSGYEAGGVISEDEMDVVPGTGNGSAIRLHNVRGNVSWREQAEGHSRSNSRM